jgi:lipopolysaccharide transport system ATP-binding protein
MSDVAIRVEHLSKRYKLGEREPYKSLRDVLARVAAAPFSRLRGGNKPKGGDEYLWALDDVSFEVKQGEAVGIIGRNGAGKSTLLKVLSRITKPTKGRAEIYGRVSSLLEVGTGFHPELTGRENIYLNGAILGMKRSEIQRKFDEIVDFAEIEKFLDTPVKRYSSGMYVRLAFAVAAHLEPEILLVDEVLAVGDAAFQKKCLGKMEDVAEEGRTILFVSHNLAAVQNLCKTTILIEKGKLSFNEITHQVIANYFRMQSEENSDITILDNHIGRRPGMYKVLREIHIFTDGHESSTIRMGGNLCIQVLFRHISKISNIRFGIAIEDPLGQRLINFSPSHQAPHLVNEDISDGIFECIIPSIHLLPGIYYITVIIGNGSIDLDRIDRAVKINVESSDVFGTGYAPNKQHGIFYQEASWSLKKP